MLSYLATRTIRRCTRPTSCLPRYRVALEEGNSSWVVLFPEWIKSRKVVVNQCATNSFINDPSQVQRYRVVDGTSPSIKTQQQITFSGDIAFFFSCNYNFLTPEWAEKPLRIATVTWLALLTTYRPGMALKSSQNDTVFLVEDQIRQFQTCSCLFKDRFF